MGIAPISDIVLLILKVARDQHSFILTDPALRENPAWIIRRGFCVLELVTNKKRPPENNSHAIVYTVNAEGRKILRDNPVGFDRMAYSLNCHMGVWDEGVCPVDISEDSNLFSQDRGNDCFFIPYKKLMLLPASIELQKRGDTNRRIMTSYKLTIAGLLIASRGLLLNALVALFMG